LRSLNPYAVLLASSEAHGLSGHPSPIYPHIRLITECLLLTGTKNLQTGGCPWLLTSDLYHLPLAFTFDQGSQLGAEVWTPVLVRPVVAIFMCTPFEIHTSLANLGLTFCRAVTDLTPDFPFPPIPFSIYLTVEAAGLRRRVRFSLPAFDTLSGLR